MKLLLIIICIASFYLGYNSVGCFSCHDSCREKKHVFYDGQLLPMPESYRTIFGFDSIQIIAGGRGKYNDSKQDYDVTWDSPYVNFCYPNKFLTFKKDTVFIHDTIRITQYSNKEPELNVGSARITVKFTPIQTAKK